MSGPPSAKRAKQAERETIQLFRSYKYQDIPDIAFYGRSKEEIKSYIKDEMVKQGSYSPSYYEFTLDKEYKLLDLSSEEGQVLLKTLFESPTEAAYISNRELFYQIGFACTLLYFVTAYWAMHRRKTLNNK